MPMAYSELMMRLRSSDEVLEKRHLPAGLFQAGGDGVVRLAAVGHERGGFVARLGVFVWLRSELPAPLPALRFRTVAAVQSSDSFTFAT